MKKPQNLDTPLQLPLLTSKDAGWKDIDFEYHIQPPYEISESCSTKHIIGINCCQHPVLLECTTEGRLQRETLVDKEITVKPAGSSHKLRWKQDHEFIRLFFDPSLIERIAYETFNLNTVEITPHFINRDPLVHHLTRHFKRVVGITPAVIRRYLQ
jgi:AraC family transcriptional regulator